MPMKHTRRQFLTALASAGAAGLMRAPAVPAVEGGSRRRPLSGWYAIPAFVLLRNMPPKNCCAPRA